VIEFYSLMANQFTTLVFCFYELARNKNVFIKAREEVDRVIGDRKEITYQDLNKLKYCSSIFVETQRLYDTDILRVKSQKEMNLYGLRIPKNTYIHINKYAIERNDKLKRDSSKFNPDTINDDILYG
jgi:cholesterol 24(S)-hydroxylase